MNRKAKISLVSFGPLKSSEKDRLKKTLAKMEDCVDQSAQLKSDLIAFPEICNYLGDINPWQFEPLDGPTVNAMSRKAKQHNLYVVCPLGTIENGNKYNSSVLIDRNGEIVGVYHKNFPTHAELDIGIIPGIEAPAFQTDFGRVGLSICFDINYWEVGSELCKNGSELVIWSSMWPGERMLTKWAIEFGFYIGSTYARQSTFVDIAGREMLTSNRNISDATGKSPVSSLDLDLNRRLLHHDNNIERLQELYKKYGATAAYCEWLPQECLIVFGSQIPDISSDELIEEFKIETMRSYLARVRKDRQLALNHQYPVVGSDF